MVITRSFRSTAARLFVVASAVGAGLLLTPVPPASADAPSSAVLLFDSTIGGVQGIYTMPLTGGTPTKIATGTQPAWAPGGTRIAYVNAAGQLVVAAANGTWSTVVPTTAGGTVTSLSWSNDGSRIAYTISHAGDLPSAAVHVHNLMTDADEVLTVPAAISLGNVSWSPTSDTLVVGDVKSSWFVNADSGTVTGAPGASFEYCCSVYSWSPDGTRLLEQRYGGSNVFTIESMNLDGSNVTTYATGSATTAAAFTPDGVDVVYQVGSAMNLSVAHVGVPGAVSSVAVGGVVSSLSIASVDSGASVGYALAEASGAVHTFGAFEFRGQAVGTSAHPVVGVVSTPDRGGYWLVASDGGVFSFGDARFFGSTGNLRLTRPVVGMVSTADGGGYWLVASDGGVFSFGDARFYGSTGALALVKPVVGMAATLTGHGYWLVAADGGVFTFGDAAFYGSTGNLRLTQPVVGMAATLTGHGYWLVAADGGVFTFGDAAFYGSGASVAASSKTVGVAVTPDGAGYTLLSRAGGILTFGDAGYFGNAAAAVAQGNFVGITN